MFIIFLLGAIVVPRRQSVSVVDGSSIEKAPNNLEMMTQWTKHDPRPSILSKSESPG